MPFQARNNALQNTEKVFVFRTLENICCGNLCKKGNETLGYDLCLKKGTHRCKCLASLFQCSILLWHLTLSHRRKIILFLSPCSLCNRDVYISGRDRRK